jgi:hypothetical protein
VNPLHTPDALPPGGSATSVETTATFTATCGCGPGHRADSGLGDRVGPRLRTTLITPRQGGEFIARRHGHHPPTAAHKVSVGIRLAETDRLVGVAVIRRPIARRYAWYDAGQALEVLRTCTHGTRNANSPINPAFYGAAWRASRALGATRAITYTQRGESGASPPAAGRWGLVAIRGPAGGWDRPSRPRRAPRYRIRVPRVLWLARWLVGGDLPPVIPQRCSDRGPR